MEATPDRVLALDKQTRCPREIARTRKSHLKGGGPGFPSFFLPILRESFNTWTKLLSMDDARRGRLEERKESVSVRLLLSILKRIASLDATLDDEIAREGSHVMISKIINADGSMIDKEEDQDCLMEIQDLACEIAALSSSFPLRISPYTTEELTARMPLEFQILPTPCEALSKNMEEEEVENHGGVFILIHQVNIRQSEQKDVGFVMWPSAVALSHWLLLNPDELKGNRILELGAGCGLVGLVAGKLVSQQCSTEEKHQSAVTITDFNEIVVKNANQNIHLNGVGKIAEAVGLDFFEQDADRDGWIDSAGNLRQQVDLVLAADVICQPEDAFAAARSIKACLHWGGKAVTVSGDLKHRYGVECFEGACTELGLKVTKYNVGDLYEGSLISSNMEKTSGYVEGMSLSMFIVEKTNA